MKYNKELRFGKTGSGRLFGRAVPKIYAVQLTGEVKGPKDPGMRRFEENMCVFFFLICLLTSPSHTITVT